MNKKEVTHFDVNVVKNYMVKILKLNVKEFLWWPYPYFHVVVNGEDVYVHWDKAYQAYEQYVNNLLKIK